MRRSIMLAAISALVSGCDSHSKGGMQSEITLAKASLADQPTDTKDMNRLDRVMGTLLETWEHRYTFEHDREEPKLTFDVPGFTLTVVEEGDGEKVAILFEEAGTKHRAICTADEAPKVIESLLLLPAPEAE